MPAFRRVVKHGSTALAFAVLLSGLVFVSGAEEKKPPVPKEQAKPAPRQAGNPGGGAPHGPTTAGPATHGPTANGPASHGPTTFGGPTANGPATHGPTTAGGPTANGPATHGPTTTGAPTANTTPSHVCSVGLVLTSSGACVRPGAGSPSSNTTSTTTTGNGTHTTTTTTNSGGSNGTRGSYPSYVEGSKGNTGNMGGPSSGGRNSNSISNTNNQFGRNGTGQNGMSTFRGPAPKGSQEHVTQTGAVVRTRPNGQLSDLHDPKRGMDLHHALNGNRKVFVERPDHSRIFAERGHRGFVEHPYGFRGHDFARRTYFSNGRMYSRFYHGFGFRGLALNVYAPAAFFRPAFYGWAYNPWAVPISFGWGWGGSPWFGYYGGYFQPAPMYPSAAFWLTDYIIANDLQAAYANQQQAGGAQGDMPGAGGPPALSPDIKQQIADEVRNQLALENQEAQMNAQQQNIDPGSSGIPRLLSDGHPHVFVAGATVDVVRANGQECEVSEGDVLGLDVPPPPDATSADLRVLASKGGSLECPRKSMITVQFTDLQEMMNHMREGIDQGLQDLQAKQGTGGLPQDPPSAAGRPVQAGYAAIAPPPDPNAGAEIDQQTRQADQAENESTVPSNPY